jgi:hypothetical protein
MRTEENIREAFRQLARSAPNADSILAGLPERPGGRASGGRRRARRLLAPVGASVAVVAVVTASIAIASGGHLGGGVSRSTIAPGAEAPGRGLPSYYVAIMSPLRERGLVTTVRDTRTGAVLATVNPPKGYVFGDATAGPNDDSFVLAAQHLSPTLSDPEWLYLLRFNPVTLSIKLIRLPIPPIPYPAGLTISPGGTELAAASAGPNGSELVIYSLSGRLIRQWQDPGGICPGETYAPCPSWSASGYLAFDWVNYNATMYGGRTTTSPVTGSSANGVRMIRSTAASGSLVGASRLAVPFKVPNYINFVLSRNGRTIAGDFVVRSHRGTMYDVYEEFSAATGKPTGQHFQSPADALGGVFWSNQTGSTLIIRLPPNMRLATSLTTWPLGVLTGGRFTPLPTPAGPWQAFAF